MSEFKPIVNFKQDTAIEMTGTRSEPVDLTGRTLVGFITPSGLAGTAVTFEVSDELEGIYRQLTNASNAAISATVDATGKQYALTSDNFLGVRFLRLVSDASETNKTFTLVSRPVL